MTKSFTDLRVWQSAHELTLKIYKYTELFPKSETYGLVQQMRRSSVSVGSNLAEGFGRASAKDRQHFYIMASGSLYELKNQLLVSIDLGYIKNKDSEALITMCNSTHKQLNALIKVHKSSVQNPISNV